MRFAQSSGEQTADAAIFAGPCAMTRIVLISDGTNDPKIVIYDNASAASGTVKGEHSFDVSQQGEFTRSIPIPHPVLFQNGIYADISGTGASYIIEFIPL